MLFRSEEVFNKRAHNGYMSIAMLQTDCFIRLLKKRTGSHVIGFFVGESKDIVSRVNYFFPSENGTSRINDYAFMDKLKENFRKSSSLVVTTTGFDDYYVLRSNSLDTDDADELVFKDNATTRGMVSAFSKYTGSKISSRVILNRFIGLIS